MALRDETQAVQNSPLVFDALLCEEDSVEEDYSETALDDAEHVIVGKASPLSFVLLESDLFWEEDELLSLLSREEQTHFDFNRMLADQSLLTARQEAVRWISKVSLQLGFTALTVVLGVNYFDRFSTGLTFQKDKPWMTQLAAVACLSLAAKVEETHVPFLLDLQQVEETKYLFEAKTIQRMELLVLSTLEWRMNPVTPISYFEHIVRRLGLKTPLHWDFLRGCELLLLSVIADSRIIGCLPSTLAAATMIRVTEEIEPCNAMEYHNQLLGVMKINEEQVRSHWMVYFRKRWTNATSSYPKYLDRHDNIQISHSKRKHLSVPSSPDGVIDAPFSCDSSNDSWAVSSPVSLSLAPRFKKSRSQDQPMRLSSLSNLSVDVLASPP